MSFQGKPSIPPGSFPDDQIPLFVYGTLRRTQENYTLLRGYTLHEQAARIEGFALYSVNTYPVVTPGDRTVYGELMWLNPHVYERVLQRLDEFERFRVRPETGTLQRTLCEANTGSIIRRAWLYQAEKTLVRPEQLVPHGDWVKAQIARLTGTRLERYLNIEIQKGM
ncbi:MAG: gamma-glutamylcyclotransferase [Anaerolineae bacterium]|nr:gamma-glutamylcyclotransferase [Anaerolineae bacterium]